MIKSFLLIYKNYIIHQNICRKKNVASEKKLLLTRWNSRSPNGVSFKPEKDLESSIENICSGLSSDRESINVKWHDINLLNRGQH